MGAGPTTNFYGRLKRARHALSEAGWSWAERGTILVGLSWLLLRARGDSTPIPRRISSRRLQASRPRQDRYC